MPASKPVVSWAPKVAKTKIRRLYESDARCEADPELADEVGWALWSRCDSILEVTRAHYGSARCPVCAGAIESPRPWLDSDVMTCPACGWSVPWLAYHQTYKGKQLFGANAVEPFQAYHRAFPQADEYSCKMLLIDQLIHAFHTGLTELGRPVGANLIEGNLREVIAFLDALTFGPGGAAGLEDAHDEWRRNLESVGWSKIFLSPRHDGD